MLPAAGFTTPSVYEANGKRYVVVACGDTSWGRRRGWILWLLHLNFFSFRHWLNIYTFINLATAKGEPWRQYQRSIL
jgi:hypothetical protein